MSDIATKIHYKENKKFIDYINKCGGVVPTEQCKEITSEALKSFKIDKEQLRKNAEFLIPKLKWYQKILQKLHIKDYYKSYNEYMEMLEKIEDYKSRNEKAIEYIKDKVGTEIHDMMYIIDVSDVLDILQGEDNS